MHFNFIAGYDFDLNSLSSVDRFVNTFPDFQSVTLADEHELKILLELMGIAEFESHDINNNIEFTKYWDISGFKLPEFDDTRYDKFYEDWLQRTNRKTSMNEYGSLIFLQGLTPKWNKLKYRLIIKEEY